MMKLLHKPLFALLAALPLLFAACGTKPEEKAPKIAVEDFFKNPEKFSWRISPDGEYISYLSPHNGHTNVFVRKISDTVAIPVTNDTVRNVYRYQWKGNRIIYLQDVGGDENFQMFSVGSDGKETESPDAFSKSKDEIFDDWGEIPGKGKRNDDRYE
jgi:hypothetical protein